MNMSTIPDSMYKIKCLPDSVIFKASIAGGLPILVEATIMNAEPDVGIFRPEVDELFFTWQTGKNKALPDSLIDRITDKEDEEIREEALRVAMSEAGDNELHTKLVRTGKY